MKKSLLLLAALVATAASAQTKGNIEATMFVGLNGSTVSDGEFSADSGNGLNAGVSAEYYFSPSWGIKAKVIYDQKGWDNGFYEVETASGTESYVTDYNLNYVTIPVMANWHFGNTKNWYLNFGLYTGFLVSARETSGDQDVKEFFNSNDFGLAFGIGVKIPVSDKIRILIEYDGQSGFSNVFADSVDDITNSRSAFNVGVAFLMK